MLSTNRRHCQDNLDAWLLQNVQKVDSLKTIKICNIHLDSEEDQGASTFGLFYVDLLRHLSFKYPNVELFDVDRYEQKNQPIPQSLFENASNVGLENCMIDSIDLVQDMIDI